MYEGLTSPALKYPKRPDRSDTRYQVLLAGDKVIAFRFVGFFCEVKQMDYLQYQVAFQEISDVFKGLQWIFEGVGEGGDDGLDPQGVRGYGVIFRMDLS